MSEEELINRLLNSIAIRCDGNIADEVKAIIIKQQKEIKELMKTCDLYKSASDHIAEIFSESMKPNYISKDKIKEKIKELEKSYKNGKIKQQRYYDAVILLEELLEEK